MFAIGDTVVFTRDGSMGIITGMKDNRCQVIWEDHFVSWENELSLQKAEKSVESGHQNQNQNQNQHQNQIQNQQPQPQPKQQQTVQAKEKKLGSV